MTFTKIQMSQFIVMWLNDSNRIPDPNSEEVKKEAKGKKEFILSHWQSVVKTMDIEKAREIMERITSLPKSTKLEKKFYSKK